MEERATVNATFVSAGRIDDLGPSFFTITKLSRADNHLVTTLVFRWIKVNQAQPAF